MACNSAHCVISIFRLKITAVFFRNYLLFIIILWTICPRQAVNPAHIQPTITKASSIVPTHHLSVATRNAKIITNTGNIKHIITNKEILFYLMLNFHCSLVISFINFLLDSNIYTRRTLFLQTIPYNYKCIGLYHLFYFSSDKFIQNIAYIIFKAMDFHIN